MYARRLRIVLTVSAIVLLTAVFPALFPFSWMRTIHERLGMGVLPEAPIVGYLTRSLSALYAFHGAIVLYLSFRVRHYLPAIRFVATVGIGFAAYLFALDAAAGMPLWWTIAEGSSVLAINAAVLLLAVKAEREDRQPS